MRRYLVLVMRTPRFDAGQVRAHVDFLDRLDAEGRLELAGPFTDQSGGAYLLRADHLEHARELAHADPLHTSGSSEVTVLEWAARPGRSG